MSTINEAALPKLTLIKAGAGSGKTFGIQKQLTEWVLEGRLKPEKILAVTFTNGGAAELRERIRANLLKASLEKGKNIDEELAAIDKAQITTIHGFGLSLVERFAYEKGISPKPRQLNEAEQAQLIKLATSQLEELEGLIQQLDKFGYTGFHGGKKFVSGTDQLRGDIFKIIERMRGLSLKETEALSNDNKIESLTNNLQNLKQAAKDTVTKLYGKLSKESESQLNKKLLEAVRRLKNKSQDVATLKEAAGVKDFHDFANAVFEATEDKINGDWKFWTRLQYVEKLSNAAAKRVNDQELGEGISAVWSAAGMLPEHPGPLNQALQQVEDLFSAAFAALSKYKEGKEKAALVDFTDMVQLAQQIVNNKECFEELKKEVECLVIDEFQDTNPLQFSLLKPFMDAGIPTYVVGDLKQSIMGFQGADSRLMARLWDSTEAKDKIVIKKELKENWRSSTKVMAFVNKMGKELYGEKGYKNLKPKAETDKEKPPYKENSHFDIAVRRIIFDEASWGFDNRTKHKPVFKSAGYAYLAKEIHKLVECKQQVIDKHNGMARDINYSDIAILASKHSNLYDFAERLRAANIPVRLAEDGWYESESVQYALNALQYLNNSQDHYAALSLITSPLVNANLQEALEDFYANKEFTHEQLNYIEKLKNTKGEDLRYLHERPVKAQLLSLIDELSVFGKIQTLNEGGQLRANLVKLLSLAEEFEQTAEASLQAAGVYGRSAHAFSAWVKVQSEEDNRQPADDNPSQDAVVLKTWHGSKGLEWPVVLVLDAHEEREPRLPHISVSYRPNASVEEMLKNGCIDFLPSMADKTKKEEFLASLQQEAVVDQKNLIYVALTRAREQIILPWFKAEEQKPNSLIGYLDGLLSKDIVDEYWEGKAIKVNHDEFPCAEKEQKLQDAIKENAEEVLVKQASTQKQLQLKADKLEAPIAAVVTPSEYAKVTKIEQVSSGEIKQEKYGSGLDFSELDKHLHPSEVGTWVHRLYHVQLKQPGRLSEAMQLIPKDGITLTDELKNAIVESLKSFEKWLEEKWPNATYQCELPILGTQKVNGYSQTISGTIDLLVETDEGYWIVDYKSDKDMKFSDHYGQLMAYVKALELDKPVLGVAVNWVRESLIELKKMRKYE